MFFLQTPPIALISTTDYSYCFPSEIILSLVSVHYARKSQMRGGRALAAGGRGDGLEQRGFPDKGDLVTLSSLLPCSLSLKSFDARRFSLSWRLLQNTPCNFFTRKQSRFIVVAEDPSLEPLDLLLLGFICCLFIFISPSLSTLIPNSNKPSTLFDISPYLNTYPLSLQTPLLHSLSR